MLWDRKNQEYCKYRNGRGPGDWRAPEEFNDDPLDEKIDIYSLANNMYAVVTGAYPYWELGDHSAVREKVTSGEKPKFDKRWAENSYAEGKLMELLEQMFEFDPVKRIDIFGVVKYLRELAEENQKHIMTDDPKAKKFLERKKKEAEMREKVRSAAREQERKVKAARKAKEEEEKAAAKARYEEAGKARDDVTRKEQDAEDDKSEANASDKRDAE